MSNTFLKEVHLKDFRTFGDFTLPIPPGPGLTLLVGTNGLGKSSFFDGIEWCVTGTVRRFAGYASKYEELDYLTRRDAPKGVHQVSLTFCDGAPMVRGLGQQPSAHALLGVLKDSSWDNIDDLGAFLGFTHFLGQASQQRFTSREKNDQWQALKGPSGIDRLESIRTALRGRATTFAFKRRTEHETSLVDTAIKELEAWQGSVARLAELEARGTAVGAVNEESLEKSLAAIERTLPASSEVPNNFMIRLGTARATVEAEQRLVLRSRGELDALRNLVDRFAGATRSLQQESDRLTNAAAVVDAATTQLSEAMVAASRAEQAAAEQALVVALVDAKHQEHVSVRAAIVELDALGIEWHAAKENQSEIRVERDARATDLLNVQQQLTAALEAHSTLSRLDASRAALHGWAARAGALNDLERAAQDQRDAADVANANADFARSALPELQKALDTAREAELNAETRVMARRKNASELAELLSGLTAHIGHDDIHCPVCASTFAEGDLQKRAQSALALQDLHLADDVRSLDELRKGAQVAAHALTLAQTTIAAATVASSDADTAKAGIDAERAAIAQGMGASRDGDLASIAAERLNDALLAREVFLRDKVDGQADFSSAQARVDAVAAALASLEDRLGVAIQRFARLEARRVSIEASLGNHPKPWNAQAADAAVEQARGMQAIERAKLENVTLARAAAANAESAARDRLAAANGEQSRVVAAIHNAEVVRSAAINSWQQAGMLGEPAAESIDARERVLVDRATALAEHAAEINSLARSFEACLAQDELRTLRFQMDLQGGAGAADKPAPRAQVLQGKLLGARTALRLTTETRDAVIAYGDQLRTKAESFSNQFLLPLNNLIDAFNRALLSTPGESVQFNAEHTVERTSLGMQLRYADAIENAQYKTSLPPQLVLSEGQMAANGFSILCAASTAYRWSRWRALLLDDPLQHNDIIHAAAFVDVMRNLVEFEGYQLIMSSHKRDEGEFIARKFDAADIPCTVVELVGASKAGVRVAPPRHNAAARRLLAESQAQVA